MQKNGYLGRIIRAVKTRSLGANLRVLEKKLLYRARRMKETLKFPRKERTSEHPARYIHVGYPKAASTAIQNGYFGRHNQLLHLGCGNRTTKGYWDDHGYICGDINTAMEIDLRYKTRFAYDASKTHGIFDKYFRMAEEDRYIHAVGISNENFCFNWHGGIDIAEKAHRLRDIFGGGTGIVFVVRDQKSMIESLYMESVRFGYPGTFSDYLKYLWTYKDRNFLYEFCFDNTVGLYEDVFGKDHTHVLYFEDLKAGHDAFLASLSACIGIDYHKLDFSQEYNKQLNRKELSIKRVLNSRFPHTFGKGGVYDVIDTHRFVPYFTDDLGDAIDDEVFMDYWARQKLNDLSALLNQKISAQEIELDWNNRYGEQILCLFSDRNRAFASGNPQRTEKLTCHKYQGVA